MADNTGDVIVAKLSIFGVRREVDAMVISTAFGGGPLFRSCVQSCVIPVFVLHSEKINFNRIVMCMGCIFLEDLIIWTPPPCWNWRTYITTLIMFMFSFLFSAYICSTGFHGFRDLYAHLFQCYISLLQIRTAAPSALSLSH